MASKDRTIRNLVALQRTASTSRVLNLAHIEKTDGGDPDYAERPLFADRVLNTAVIIKHRLGADEHYILRNSRGVATKIIIPFDRRDLGIGGRSLLVGQRGWSEMLRGVCSSEANLERDMKALEALDELPSLDPFLLREHLKRRGFDIARCYFKLSPADSASMQTYVCNEIASLIEKAYPGGSAESAMRLAEALLSSAQDDRLEPLRLTLKLEGEAYREGVFSWKGFLYYKWALKTALPALDRVVQELPRLKAIGAGDAGAQAYVKSVPGRLQQAILREQTEVAETLAVYDRAFSQLSKNNNPMAFRDFLLSAPDLFLSLGERLGTISHISTFWASRFPVGFPLVAQVTEIADFAQEFEACLTSAKIAA